MSPLLAVPNVSEGRDAARVDRIADAFSTGTELLDTHVDAEHNRSVFTLLGEPGGFLDSLLEGAASAISEIDMRRHEGLHPCVGVLDVLPIVWLAAEDRRTALDEAESAGAALAGGFDLPVFYYGELASSDERRERAFFRRGGLAELARRMEAGELQADVGPDGPNPGIGATLVTARPPLVAFNVELEADGEVAREVASELRESGGGLPGVRAIGLSLESGRGQVSTNVHDPLAVPLARVVEEVRRLASARGAEPVEGELVGLAPEAAMAEFPDWLPLPGFDPERHLIERRLPGP